MEQAKKRTLLNMTYYALVSVTILLGVVFMIYLATQTVPLYAKIGYWIIVDSLIGIIIFDIICTNIKKFKYIVGIILFVLSIIAFALNIIVYISLSTDLILTAIQLYPFLALWVMSWTMVVFTITLFVIGIKLIEKTRRVVK